MSVKGEIIVEGAKIYCSSAQTFKSKGASVPLNVKSQQKKLGKNKYFAQDKPIATTQDTKAESINNGEGFVMCQDPKNTQTGYSPCKSKCKIEYKDYYENVDFDKGMKALIDKTTGICQGYGVPGTIQFATSGQTKAVSVIDIKNTDEFQIQNISSQWETAPVSKENAVNSIAFTAPTEVTPQGKYYFIKELAPVNAYYNQQPTSFIDSNTVLKLKADYKGDATKITWALFKGTNTKDKVKSFVGIGANITLKLEKLFENLPEGDYRIEAYMNKAGDEKCAIVIEYIIDQMESLTVNNKTLLKNNPIQVSAKFKTTTIDFKKVLNPNYNTTTRPVPIAYWKIKQKDVVLVNTATAIDTSLVRLDLIKAIAINEIIAIINFKNAGEYTLQAYTYIGDQSPLTANFTVVDSLSINTVKAESNALLRYNDVLKVSVDKFNVDNVFNDGTKAMQWYLQKDGVQLSLFEQSAVSKKSTINKRIDQIIYNDAQAGNNYFGKYAIEAYGKALENPKKPTFKGADTYFFEVVKNRIESLVIPPKVPKGAIVNCETTARIMPLVSGEVFQIDVPQGVTKNSDGSLMFSELGEYEITAQLTGAYTDNKKITQKIKVADPVLKEALWAYGTGYKRTQTGYKEDTHAFVEIAGLENQTITIKVWLRGDGDSFYLQPDKYMLEEKKVTLNDKGKGSFMITTSDRYKEKIEKAIPPTIAVPNPSYRLVFTVELPTGKQGAVTLPIDMNLEYGKPIKGANLYEVLDPNEELELTSEKLIKSIVFSTTDSKDVQQGITFYGKTHKIWVHTVNMIDDELKVEVFKEVPIDNLTETQNIIYTHESKETYKEEKVGSDGLLELSFTPKEEWNTTCKNIDYYVASVSMKVKDEQNCDVWKVMSTQVRTNDAFPVSLEYDKEREKMGMKAFKKDNTPFTKEEMEILRGKFIQYTMGALKVSPYTDMQPEIKQGAPLVVELPEMAEIEKSNKVCESEARVRAFMRMLRVGEGTGELIKSYDKKKRETIYAQHNFQEGYTTAFGGNKITDLSKHPEKNYGGSSAAGAYQVMRYVWWEISGWEVKDKQKTDKYDIRNNILLKHSIRDYSAESQDKICLIIMKRQKPNLINKIIAGDIESAIKQDACFIWASLPENGDKSHYKYQGELQPATPLALCIEHYNKFLKEELLGISPLHLRKGFLKEFGYDCCKNEENVSLSGCDGKKEIDLRNQMTFQAQQTKTDCNLTCRKIMNALNVTPENPSESGNQSFYQTAIESNDNTSLILNDKDFKEGMKYIDFSLEAGYPVMVGVNHTLNYGYNETPNTSDHYVIIVGRYCDNNVLKYRFWDVATRRGAEGDFKFTLTKEKLYSEEVWKKNRVYTLTQVRRNRDSNGKLITF